ERGRRRETVFPPPFVLAVPLGFPGVSTSHAIPAIHQRPWERTSCTLSVPQRRRHRSRWNNRPPAVARAPWATVYTTTAGPSSTPGSDSIQPAMAPPTAMPANPPIRLPRSEDRPPNAWLPRRAMSPEPNVLPIPRPANTRNVPVAQDHLPSSHATSNVAAAANAPMEPPTSEPTAPNAVSPRSLAASDASGRPVPA